VIVPTAPGGMADILARHFAQKFGERGDGVVTIDLRLTHQDLAAMVASTRESVTKVLNEMRNRDLIEIEAGRITLKDSRALAELGS
jgi:CRP/FNR family transcriptional regulator